MVRPGREQLTGLVEVDETYLAIRERHLTSEEAASGVKTTKTIVAIAVELHEPKGFGRIRLRRIPNASEQCLLPLVVERGAMVSTDGSFAYRSVFASASRTTHCLSVT